MERILEFKASFLRKFGRIIEFQEHWEDGYCFVVYENKDDAKIALATLKDFAARRSISTEVRARLREEGKDPLVAPGPSFYVRWPQFYLRLKPVAPGDGSRP